MANTDLVNEGLLGAYHDELMKTHLAGGVVFDISAYNLTNGQPTPYADLAAAIGTNGANIPEPLRKGGMSVKFIQGTVQSPDKYVQYRLTSNYWSSNPNNWLNVEEIDKTLPIVKIIGVGSSGAGTLVESNHITDLLSGHTYYLWIKDVNALQIITSSSASFEVWITDSVTPILLYVSAANSSTVLKDFYEITLPNGYNEIYIKVRQPTGVEFKAYLQDATYSSSVIPKNELPIKTSAVYQDVKLDKYGLISHELDINGIVTLVDLFEIGNIGFYGSAPEYIPNNNRVRTVEGHSIYLKEGDVISPINTTDFRFFTGWWDNSGSWHYTAWRTSDYEVTQDGHYVLLLSNVTEVEQTSAETLASNIAFKRETINATISNIINELAVFDKRLGDIDFKTNPFTKNGITIDAEENPGELIERTGYSCTDFIPIIGGKRYKCAMSGTGSSTRYNIAFYYKSGDSYIFISGHKGSSNGILDKIVPDNATYCVLSASNGFIGKYGMDGIFPLDKFARTFGDFLFFDEYNNKMLWPNVIPAADEYVGGNFVTNIFYYNVLPYKQIAFNIQNENNSYGVRISCYDTNFNFISFQQILSNNPIYVVPSNAVFIKLSISELNNGNLSPTNYTQIVEGMITIDNDNTQLKGDSSKNVDFLGLDNLYVIGHRANTGLPNIPENSVHAVYASAIQGVRAVECDVRLTSDNYPYIMHDSTINRTMMNADGTEISGDIGVSDLTWQELRTGYVYKTSIEKYRTPVTSLDEWLDAVKECHLVPFMHGCPTNLLYKVIERFGNKFIYMHGYATLLTVRTMAPNCLCLYDIGGSSETEAQLLTDLKNIGGFAGLSSMYLSAFTDNLIKTVKDNGFYLQYSSNYDYPNAIAKGVDMILTNNWCNDSLSYRNLYRMKDDLSNITYVNTIDGCPVYSINDTIDIQVTNVKGTNIKILINAKGSLTAKVNDISSLTYQLTGDSVSFKTFEVGYNTNVDSFTLRLTAITELVIKDIVIQES